MAEAEEVVHLNIKAPNQNCDDQVVHCNLDWTVIQVKQHLSQVYPSKPLVKDQKLIYSGRLLDDHLQMKEVLRRDDTSTEVHMFHLVCNPLAQVDPEKSSHVQHRRSSSSSSDGSQFSDLDDFAERWNSSYRSLPQSDASDDYSGSSGETSIRSSSPYSATASIASNPDDCDPPPSIPRPHYCVHPTANSSRCSPSPSASSWPFSQNPQAPSYDYTAQMAAYQQMYNNYYTQYMQAFQSMSVQNNVPVMSSAQPNTVVVTNNQNAAAAAAAAVSQPARNRNAAGNAQREAAFPENDNNPNRDWLDYFYVWCRGFVLFSIVYFYSSPERLLLVVGLGLLAFLYQEGWLLARLRQNRVAENLPNPPQPVAHNENQNHVRETQPQQNDNLEEMERPELIEAIMDGEDPPHLPHRQVTNQQNPAWTFVTSFFSSLIPEPPAPVNIN